MFKLITHPNNIIFINQFTEEIIRDQFDLGVFTNLNGIEVITNSDIPEFAKSKTDFEEVCPDKFVAHSTHNAKDWEIYFGFVKPAMVRQYILYEDMSGYTYAKPHPKRIFI